MGADEDRDYDAAQPGYGAADAEVDEDTPPQEQQQPEHEQAGFREPRKGSTEETDSTQPKGRQ